MQSCSVAIHYNSPGSRLAAGTTKNAINARGGDAEVFQADLTKVSNASMVPCVLIETPCSGHATDYASICLIRCFVLKRTSSQTMFDCNQSKRSRASLVLKDVEKSRLHMMFVVGRSVP